MNSLFSNERIDFDLPQAEISYIPDFLNKQEALKLLQNLEKNTPWQQDEITLFGKTHLQPRLTAFYGAENLSYSYSNIQMKALSWTSNLLGLKNEVEKMAQTTFNCV